MLFLPSTSIPNIRLNVQIILSIAIFTIGFFLSLSQIFVFNEVINKFNLISGFVCLTVGFLSMYSASKGYKVMMPVLLVCIYSLLTFIFFKHTDATLSSPVVLCGYIALIALISFKYHWVVSLVVTLITSATALARVYLIDNGIFEVVVGDNPIWLNNLIILTILVFICILTGYYGYEMNKFAKKLTSDNTHNLDKMISEHKKNELVLQAIKKIDAIYLKHASVIDEIIITNNEKLSLDNDISYNDLLAIGNAVSEAVDSMLIDINNNIEKV